MATQLLRSGRKVAYLPSLKTVIIRCRNFSSATNKFDFSNFELEEDPTGNVNSIQWPEDVLGLLSPPDKRFPLPGLVGACANARRLMQEQLIAAAKEAAPPRQISLHDILPPLLTERHSDIADQFLTSIDEIDDILVDSGECTPSPMDKLECVAHNCPTLLRKEFKDLFPDHDLMDTQLTIITLSQKTENDMTLWSTEVEEEREALLEMFIQGAVEISKTFEDAGFWSDFIDPSSGKPFKSSHTNFTLFETDERYRTIGFEIRDLGCCKVISHPVWGTHAFVGCMFTSAPLNHPVITSLVRPH